MPCFSSLLEILPNNVLLVEFKTAKEIALIADSYLPGSVVLIDDIR